MQDIAIKVNSLSKKYTLKHPIKDINGSLTNEHWALKDVTFQIKKGETVGIIGPNGSGKSTLLKILSGVTKPTNGSVEINGKVASILDIGAGFHQELSGRENVFLNGQLLGFSAKEIKAQYQKIVDFSGIGNFIEEPVKYYSNGMYLRLAFSILAHLDFDIYLFDEVMNVGDAEFMQKSRQKINQLISTGKTLLIISHNLLQLNQSTQIIELEKGLLKNFGIETDILSKYISESVQKNQYPVALKSITINTFKDYDFASSIKLIHVKLFQPENNKVFVTNKEFVVEIVYDKLIKEGTFDPFLLISDSGGNIILISSPILSGDIAMNQGLGSYKVTCKIPAGLFSSNIYAISVTFVKNTHVFKKYSPNQALSTEMIKSALSEYGVVASFPNILYFKATVILNNFIDLGKLNIPVGMLLPLFNWTTTNVQSSNKT